MIILLDSILAFLSCVGLWTLGKLLLSHIFDDIDVYAEDCFLKEDTSGWTKGKITMK